MSDITEAKSDDVTVCRLAVDILEIADREK